MRNFSPVCKCSVECAATDFYFIALYYVALDSLFSILIYDIGRPTDTAGLALMRRKVSYSYRTLHISDDDTVQVKLLSNSYQLHTSKVPSH